MNKTWFCSEVELGNFLGSNIDFIADAYQAISEMTLAYELHTSHSGNKILAFNCSPEYTTRFLKREFDLIPSEKLQVIDFISTKDNSSFFINEAAVELFQHISDDLKDLEKKHIDTSLIITGWGLGGYLAILSTLRLHQAIDGEQSNGSKIIKRPICITFGSPIIGDATLRRAIDDRPQWKGSFLNVVARNDPVASFFSSDTPYKPIGTFLFCTESGGHTTFEDEDSILLVLDAMKLQNPVNLQNYDYMNVLSSIGRKVLYGGIYELEEFNFNSLRTGITLQLMEADVLNGITNDDIEKMEKKQILKVKTKNVVNANTPSKELNRIKINLIYMEWYMKSSKPYNGYYDRYKNAKTREEIIVHQEISKHVRILTHYWKKAVEENDHKPEKEVAKLGTTYRRIVEPLHIAEYYKNDKRNYINHRSNHYKLLEKWLDEDKKNSKSREEKRKMAPSITADSCFWAHVEEALILLRDLMNGGSEDIKWKLKKFEAYVMHEINTYSVSPDVFLEASSLMQWWHQYNQHKGTAYASEFAKYMNNSEFLQYINNSYQAPLVEHNDNDQELFFDYPGEDLSIGQLGVDFPIGDQSWWECLTLQFSSHP